MTMDIGLYVKGSEALNSQETSEIARQLQSFGDPAKLISSVVEATKYLASSSTRDLTQLPNSQCASTVDTDEKSMQNWNNSCGHCSCSRKFNSAEGIKKKTRDYEKWFNPLIPLTCQKEKLL